MIRFGQISWQSSARLIALASWALALALTGGMGWQAWTAIQQSAGLSGYGSTQVDTALILQPAPSAAEIIATKNRVAR
ncbi:hypothetical protein [uncultured Maricaulis sp.]|uniref:hypothetical protein n=1 Tax=uncultured Maricaulis sp. TaxID=174710 RepID=UPI0030DBC27A|tara:strand:+ start:38315 stop:38548 length:234 start_codon:yes stop_codon:yes gene_type:complete